MTEPRYSALTRYGLAVLASAAAVALRYAAEPVLGAKAPLLLLVLPVILSAWYGGVGPGLLATAGCAAVGTYLFVPPHGSLALTDPGEALRVAIFLAEGVLASLLIGSRTAALRSVRASEERFRLLVEGVQEYAIYMIDPAGRIASWNAGAARIKGYPAAEILGEPFARFYPPEDVAAGKPARELEVAAADGRYAEEGWRVRKDGSRFWAAVTITPLRDRGGRLRGFAKVTRDMTERRRAEDELRRTVQSLSDVRAALDVSSIVAITDARGRITHVNDRFVEISGYARDELLGQDHRVINSGTHPKPFFVELWRTISSGRVWRGEIRNRARAGHHYWVDTTIVPFLDPADGRPYQFVSIRNDVTARKLAEERLRQLASSLEQRVRDRTAELEEANRDLEAFGYSVSHDLRAPLRAMQGFAQAILEDYGDRLDEMGREYAGRVVTAAADMDGLIRDLLEYSRLTRRELPLEPVQVDLVVRQAVEPLATAAAAAADAGLVVSVDVDGCEVRASRPALGQVVQNLLSNAVKFVPPGRRPQVRVWCEPRGLMVRLSVRDNGIGIAAEHHGRIFNVFERLHGGEDYPGTGIGLAIVRKAAERMGGRAGVESTPGAGRTFWVELPAVAPAAMATAAAPAADDPPGAVDPLPDRAGGAEQDVQA